jgi:hypothetical protein
MTRHIEAKRHSIIDRFLDYCIDIVWAQGACNVVYADVEPPFSRRAARARAATPSACPTDGNDVPPTQPPTAQHR